MLFKVKLVCFTLMLSAVVFAQEIPTVKSKVTYNCSSELLNVVGTDGSSRTCWPYKCFNTGNPGYEGAACEVMCATSNDCQPGTSCGSNGLCEKPRIN